MLLPLLALLPLALQEPVDDLRTFYERFDQRQSLWQDARVEYKQVLAAVEPELTRTEESMREVGATLLDLASWGLDRRPRSSDYLGGADRMIVRRGARDMISRHLQGPWKAPLLRYFADGVLIRKDDPLPRRLLAMHYGIEHESEPTKLAMLIIARDEADPMWGHVVDALVEWPDEAVDSYLVQRLGKKYSKDASRHPYTMLLRRIQESDVPLGDRATTDLVVRLKTSLLSRDWRQASRAIEVTRGLEPERGVPLLLDALSAWSQREAEGRGSRRILDDIVRELRAISGKSIGRNPKNWITWWVAVRQGRAELAAENEDQVAEAPRTEATFFGLRAMTDQVTFVIDKSGSMMTEWGTTEHTRYEEAIEQMMRFLQAAGPTTRFNVILFSDEPLRSSPQLVEASAKNLAKARRSLLGREPAGGTNLRPAIELALRLDSDGNVNPARLEADTIIVLCDGETAEGKAWVKPLLRRVQSEARVRIHCVLVGVQGNGTLKALAEGTDGDFLRIGG